MSYESYNLSYCESCGQIKDGSDDLRDPLSEAVHRVDILEELGGVEDAEVHETVATEEGDCSDCGGQVVKRFYASGEVPGNQWEPDESEFVGRDSDDDSLFNDPDRGWVETSEVSGIETESDSAPSRTGSGGNDD